MAIVTCVDSSIIISVGIIINFDDQTKQEKTYTIGDEISIDYIKDRVLTSVYGKLVKTMLSPGDNSIILTIDASAEFETNVVNVNINNIRKLNEIT